MSSAAAVRRRMIVSGATGFLGRVVTGRLSAAGHRVAGIGRAQPEAGAAPAPMLIGGIDLADPAQARRGAAQAIQALGGVDVLINLAGAFRWETIESGDPATLDLLYGANVRTCFNLCQAVAPHLVSGGRIINVGAAAAVHAGAGMGAYAAAKSAVMRLTESLAAELRPRGITVNAVLPGIIDTPRNRADMPGADPAEWTSAGAIADVILFLASPGSRAITGALIPVTNARREDPDR